MDEDLKILYREAMGSLILKEAKTYGNFLSKEEFKKNVGKLFILTGAKRSLDYKL